MAAGVPAGKAAAAEAAPVSGSSMSARALAFAAARHGAPASRSSTPPAPSTAPAVSAASSVPPVPSDEQVGRALRAADAARFRQQIPKSPPKAAARTLQPFKAPPPDAFEAAPAGSTSATAVHIGLQPTAMTAQGTAPVVVPTAKKTPSPVLAAASGKPPSPLLLPRAESAGPSMKQEIAVPAPHTPPELFGHGSAKIPRTSYGARASDTPPAPPAAALAAAHALASGAFPEGAATAAPATPEELTAAAAAPYDGAAAAAAPADMSVLPDPWIQHSDFADQQIRGPDNLPLPRPALLPGDPDFFQQTLSEAQKDLSRAYHNLLSFGADGHALGIATAPLDKPRGQAWGPAQPPYIKDERHKERSGFKIFLGDLPSGTTRRDVFSWAMATEGCRAAWPFVSDISAPSGGSDSGLTKTIITFMTMWACMEFRRGAWNWWAPVPRHIDARGWRWITVRWAD